MPQTGVGSLGPCVLSGDFVALEPLTEAHFDALQAAARNPVIWGYLPIDGHSNFQRWWTHATSDPGRIAFAVRRVSDRAIVGSTSYLADTPAHARVEIGWTWYIPEVHGTAVNPEAKYLLFENAFEVAGYNRVELKTHAKNTRSRAAILKIGATMEGVLREHMWMPSGHWRDTVYYSILKSEWPDRRAALRVRLDGLQ